MTNFHEYNMIAVNYKHAEMIRQAEHARLVRAVRRSRQRQTNHFARIMRNMTNSIVTMAQRMQQRNARQVSGHAR